MGKDRRILGDSPGTIPAAGRQVVHRDPLSDVPDQWLFFGCFGLGAVAIWILKALGIGQYVVTAVPVCLMIAYAAIAIITKRYRIRADKIGDNIYYLGFLFTLVSLAYALWSFTAAASATETIITNFGIAIITTIFGLAGRVFFNQMREDPVEYEREARYSLAEATRNLKSQIDDISVELSSFKRGLVQIIEEGVTDISDKASETLLQNLSRFTEVGGAVIGKIESAFSTFTDHSVRLNNVASKNVDALDALFQRIEKIEASPDLLGAKFGPILSKFEDLADKSLARSHAHDESLKKLVDLTNTMVGTSEALHKSVNSAATNVGAGLENFSRSLESGITTTGKLSEMLEAATKAVTADLEISRNAAGRLREILDSQITASKESVEALRRIADAEIQTNREALKEIKATMLADIETMRQYRRQADEMLVDSGNMVLELEKTLVSLAHAMTEKLGGS